MSVRAYIVRKEVIYVDENNNIYEKAPEGVPTKEYIHKDQEYCFSCWSQDHIRQLILDYGGDDYTNCDCVGELEIGLDDFDALYDNESFDDPDDKESIDKMRKYFDEGNWYLTLNCW